MGKEYPVCNFRNTKWQFYEFNKCLYFFTSGLRALAVFLPASIASIVSYLSAETTRGLWKPAFMNGTDWPSPAANLSMVEQHINKLLAATGVDVPSLSAGIASALSEIKTF